MKIDHIIKRVIDRGDIKDSEFLKWLILFCHNYRTFIEKGVLSYLIFYIDNIDEQINLSEITIIYREIMKEGIKDVEYFNNRELTKYLSDGKLKMSTIFNMIEDKNCIEMAINLDIEGKYIKWDPGCDKMKKLWRVYRNE